MYQTKPYSGALFRNIKREKAKDPNMRGNISTELAKYGVASWDDDKDGETVPMLPEWEGVIFENTQKQSDKHPDMIGMVNLPEGKFILSAWLNTTKAGDEYLSMSLRKWENQFNEIPKLHQNLKLRLWKD